MAGGQKYRSAIHLDAKRRQREMLQRKTFALGGSGLSTSRPSGMKPSMMKGPNG